MRWYCGRGIVRTESGDLLAVLDQLNTDTLANGRVGLLGLDTDLLEDDALGVGGATEGGGLEGGAELALLVVQVSPALILAVHAQLARRVKSTRHDCWSEDSTLVFLLELRIARPSRAAVWANK